MTHLQQIQNLGPVPLEPSQHRGSQGTGPGEPEVANPQKRKSPRKSCSSRLTLSIRDRFSSAQHSGSSIFLAQMCSKMCFRFLASPSLAAGAWRRGSCVTAPERWDPAPAGCGKAGEILFFWNCLALIAPEDLQLLQTGFSFWLSVPAAGSRLWPHGSDPTSSKVCLQPGESSSQCAD